VSSPDLLRSYGAVFDHVAEDYDRFRSGYPDALVDRALERGGLTAGARVLEVGCGTGKLTELLVARGLEVTAVDPGARMIAEARRRVGHSRRVQFHVTRFEDAELPSGGFDAVFSATAFHWVDPAVGWRKAAACLAPHGLFALLGHVGLPDDRTPELEQEFVGLLRKHEPAAAEGWMRARDLETLLDGVRDRAANVSAVWDWVAGGGRYGLARPEAAALFEAVEATAVVRTSELDAEQLLAQFRTTSLYLRIAEERRPAFDDDYRRLLARRGGTIAVSIAALLVTARRTGRESPA
jgi:SAM-dependent methyltransferase